MRVEKKALVMEIRGPHANFVSVGKSVYTAVGEGLAVQDDIYIYRAGSLRELVPQGLVLKGHHPRTIPFSIGSNGARI